MDKNAISLYKEVCSNVFADKINDALLCLVTLIATLKNLGIDDKQNSLSLKTEQLSRNLEFILKYAFDAAIDENTFGMLLSTKQDILVIADDVMSHHNTSKFTFINDVDKYKSIYKCKDIRNLFFEIEEINGQRMLSENTNVNTNVNTKRLSEIRCEIFRHLLLCDNFTNDDLELYTRYFDNEFITVSDKCVFTSGLMFGMLNRFCINRFKLILKLCQNHDNRIKVRAATALLLCGYIYNTRLQLYPDVFEEAKRLSATDNLSEVLQHIHCQFIRCKYTQQTQTKLKEDFLDKVDMNNLFGKDDTGINTDIFNKDSISEDTIKEYAQMQFMGEDLLSHTTLFFTNSFFSEISNWFMLLNEESELFNELKTTSSSNQKMLIPLVDNEYISDPDKYGLIYTLQNMPMADTFVNKMMEAKGIDTDSLVMTHDQLALNTNVIRYIIGLSRFYASFSHANSFVNPFNSSLHLYNIAFLPNTNKFIEPIGDLFFEKGAYNETIEAYKKLGDLQTEKSIQKIGLCYQQLEDYTSALAHYNQALLYNGDDVWTLSRKAFCEYKLGNLTEAKSTMVQIIELDPDNITIRKKLANLSLSEKDYDTALKQLYYLEFNLKKEDDDSVIRLIANCLMQSGSLQKAISYFSRISHKHTADLIDIGHISYLEGNMDNMKLCYKKAYEALKDKNEYHSRLQEELAKITLSEQQKKNFSVILNAASFIVRNS